jgi:hypothetical protein
LFGMKKKRTPWPSPTIPPGISGNGTIIMSSNMRELSRGIIVIIVGKMMIYEAKLPVELTKSAVSMVLRALKLLNTKHTQNTRTYKQTTRAYK